MYRNQFSMRSGGSPFGGILSLILLVLFFVGMYYLVTGFFKLLYWLTPVIVIATLIINYRVYIDHGKWLWESLRQKPLIGILGILFSVFAFPVLAAWLLMKALAKRKIDQMREQMGPGAGDPFAGFGGSNSKREEGFTDYEEVDDTPLELPRQVPPSQEKKEDGNKYDQLFH